jgi:two-component system NtrC family sensor kinase
MLSEGKELAAQAMVRVIPTPHAKPAVAAMENSGLFLVAAAPVRDQAGNIVGALYGGVLLNNNNALVDKIKKVVYEGVKLDGRDVGGATIFLNDLRIATNVSDTEGRRAIGTRLSEEVYNRVVLMKEKWIGRAFVVNDWYFSAYEPLVSLEGAPVGALYVGMLEKPFSQLKGRLSLLVGGVLMVGGAIGVVIARLAGSRLARPIKELESFASRVAAGERGVTIEMAAEDEIGDLADELNRMSASLGRREEEIGNLNRSLEQKVRERTAELEEKNRLLMEAQQELLRVEKLAAVGELAAGVAHEINNPMAIIRGNAELIQMELPPDSSTQEEVAIITRQVGRVERIVANLLRFAREERKEIVTGSVNAILDEIIAQLKHQISMEGIDLEKRYDPEIPEIEGDLDQLRQVFTNLLLNAVQAMPEGGRLTVATGFRDEEGVIEVCVSDTGCGITAEEIDRIFNPFFTTKSGGTGLGLSVSYGIVQSHGGNITVESREGEGSRFRVALPARPA